jgi:hypothetical protein
VNMVGTAEVFREGQWRLIRLGEALFYAIKRYYATHSSTYMPYVRDSEGRVLTQHGGSY